MLGSIATYKHGLSSEPGDHLIRSLSSRESRERRSATNIT